MAVRKKFTLQMMVIKWEKIYGIGVSRYLQSNGYGVAKLRLWCCRVTVMVLQSNGYGVAA
jgi:hypothetical protein